MSKKIVGRVHSIQTMGTLDGPGVRFVVFMQGCHLRCGCCHNPDTWDLAGGREYHPQELVEKARRYRAYFGANGGITLSGGEPLLQAEFAAEVFRLCHREGIHTCLDTSGHILDASCKHLLAETDRVLLDIKYTEEALYKEHVGCSLSKPLAFLDYLQAQKISTTLRQVIIPGINQDKESVQKLKELAEAHSVVDTIELLPFRKICQTKYDALGLSFPFGHIPEPEEADMKALGELVKKFQ